MMMLTVTRDSVCMGDDVTAPNVRTIAVRPDATAAAIGWAIIDQGSLAHVGLNATWLMTLDDQYVVLGCRDDRPFVRVVGTGRVRADRLTAIHVRYRQQADPDDLIAALTLQGDERG